MHTEETEVWTGSRGGKGQVSAALVRNEVRWRVASCGGGPCVAWGSLPQLTALTRTLYCNYVFKPRPKAVKYLPAHKNVSPEQLPHREGGCGRRSSPACAG